MAGIDDGAGPGRRRDGGVRAAAAASGCAPRSPTGATAAPAGADSDEVVAALAALELVQASALIHDDLMDGSDTRRGEPAIHRRFAHPPPPGRLGRRPGGFGDAAAILLGDLCLVWSDELLHAAGSTRAPLARARPVFDQMRTEVTVGQYLDVLTQATGDTSLERAGKVARFKSAKYTVERPLLLGAALADAPAEVQAGVLGVRAAAGRGVPAARRRAGGVRRPGADRQAGRRRPARGQADLPGGGGDGDPRPGRPRAAGAAASATRSWTPRASPRLRELIVGSGALARTERASRS